MRFEDASRNVGQIPLLRCLLMSTILSLKLISAQFEQPPPWQLEYQQPNHYPDPSKASPTLGYQQLEPQLEQLQSRLQPQSQPSPQTSSSVYLNKPTDGQPPAESANPTSVPPQPQVQPSSHIPQEIPIQNYIPNFLNYPFAISPHASFVPQFSQLNPFPQPAPIPQAPLSPPPTTAVTQPAARPAFSQTQAQNQLQYTDDLQQKLQLQLQITQQIQQQIEQLQKLQELQKQSLNQQKKLFDEGKLDLDRGSTRLDRPSIYQQQVEPNRQNVPRENQELFTQHSLLPQSTIANLQFTSPVNALPKPPRFGSSLTLENVTDPALPYYLVAPALNSVSFFDQLGLGRGIESRGFGPQNLDITTTIPYVTATPPGVFGESVRTDSSGSEAHTSTEVPGSSESTERNGATNAGTEVDISTTETPQNGQRRAQNEVIISARAASRARLQDSIRRFVAQRNGQRP